ncbi:MAG: D-alanine--poly(phosphoribitol) ligase subunit 2 [Oscillospiraceae bacterium]|nr:D-alanine--poly(phosphoribitol) ligase subunit 2 [Oscillospiraceae bacterium]
MIHTKIDIPKLLYEICEDERVFEKDIDLIESGLLDSFAFIELFTKFEDHGINIQPTRIDRSQLKTVEGIEKLIEDYFEKNGK